MSVSLIKKNLSRGSCVLSANPVAVLAAFLMWSIIIFWSWAWADTPSLNKPFCVESSDSTIVLEMVPAERIGETGKGSGVARRKDTGAVLWTIDWFAHRVIVLSDGVSLIRMGPWATDRTAFSDLAVAFYRNGKEVRRYTVRELLHDKEKIIRTVSHYFWQDSSYPLALSLDEKRFTIFLIDGSICTFDPATGMIVPTRDTELIDQASQLFVQGEALYQKGQLKEARQKFKASYRLWPNKLLEKAADEDNHY
jgi:hypothetical protein